MFATQAELAAALGVTTRTLLTHFDRDPAAREAWNRGIELGRTSLRRMQFRAASRGSAALLIFLGKNFLGQSDARDHYITPVASFPSVDIDAGENERILAEATEEELNALNNAYDALLEGIMTRRREAPENKVEH